MDQFELMKAALWKDVYVAFTNSVTGRDKSNAVSWADYAVEQFEKRFKESLTQNR